MSKSDSLKQGMAALQALRRRANEQAIENFDPYPKQIEILEAGKDNQIRGFFAANGAGKSDIGAIETRCHLTGKYPSWWKGYRYTHPIQAWAVGVTNESTRDNCQRKLVGPDLENPGGGWLLPEECKDFTRRQGVSGAIDTLCVPHVSGGKSYLSFKANEQGRTKLQGPRLHWIWGDEEMDKDVFDELTFRMVGVPDAHMLITFTPLQGVTEVVLALMDANDVAGIHVVFMELDECKHPDGRTHVSDEFKQRIIDLFKHEPHVLKARMTGRPTAGSGLVFPFDHRDIFVKPFKLEKWWPRLGAIDFGWAHPTAIGAFALDPDAGTWYGYKLHYKSRTTVEQHCRAIAPWGDLQYVADPAGLQADKASGLQLIDEYRAILEGPNWKLNREPRIVLAPNAVAAGIHKIYTALEDGRLLFFDLPEFEPLKRELMLYQYDQRGERPVKKKDDAIDMIRYFENSLGTVAPRQLGYFDKKYSQFETSNISIKQWTPPVGSPGY